MYVIHIVTLWASTQNITSLGWRNWKRMRSHPPTQHIFSRRLEVESLQQVSLLKWWEPEGRRKVLAHGNPVVYLLPGLWRKAAVGFPSARRLSFNLLLFQPAIAAPQLLACFTGSSLAAQTTAWWEFCSYRHRLCRCCQRQLLIKSLSFYLPIKLRSQRLGWKISWLREDE